MPLVIRILAFFGHQGFVIRHWQCAKNMKAKIQDGTMVSEVPQSRTIKIFGVGGAGVQLLDLVIGGEFTGASFAVIDTDAPSLEPSSAPVKIQLETKLLRGLGTGGDPERGRALAEEQFSTLKTACEGATVVFILAGLGGGAGSGISSVLARAAKETRRARARICDPAVRVRRQPPPAAGAAGTRRTQGRRRRRHLPAEPEDVQVD